MAPTKKIKEAIKEQLTKEDLLKLLSEKPQKQVRKKRDLDEEAKVKMNERMAQMRVMALEKRQALKKEKQEISTTREFEGLKPSQQPKESNIDLFEKKYNSQFEKMNDTLSKLDLHLNEMKDLKKSKREMILNFGKQAMMEKQKTLEKDLENPTHKGGSSREPLVPSHLVYTRLMSKAYCCLHYRSLYLLLGSRLRRFTLNKILDTLINTISTQCYLSHFT